MAYMKNRAYGYLNAGNDSCYVENIPNQQVAGYSVGIVYIENVNYPMMPGNVVNACTYKFPVRMKAVPNLVNTRLFNNDPTIVDDIIGAARHMVEAEGVRAICSACGFFGNYQKQVAEALDVPVAMSSLVQVPIILNMLKPSQKLGILTANGESLTDSLLESCGVTDTSRIVIQGTADTPNFGHAVVGMSGHFDNGLARQEVLERTQMLLDKDDNIGAILLECSDMPPYASDIQRMTQLPVYDFITLINWLHQSVCQRPYDGWI